MSGDTLHNETGWSAGTKKRPSEVEIFIFFARDLRFLKPDMPLRTGTAGTD